MILILAEKPSVGRALSSVVGANKTNKGYIEGGGYIVSWCVGHLVGFKNPTNTAVGGSRNGAFLSSQ
jgi:DNA topoisomerase-3